MGSAVVEIGDGPGRRSMRTDEAGQFRFTRVDTGTTRLLVRRLGYDVYQARLHIGPRDTIVDIGLRPQAQRLPGIAVNGGGPGFSGVVAALHGLSVIPGASVRVVGAPNQVKTDSLGRFIVAVRKAGKYLIRASHRGYAEQSAWVEAGGDSLVDASLLLDTASVRHPDEDALWSEFDRRVKWARLSSALVPGTELRRYGGAPLSDALRAAPSAARRGLRIGSTTCVFINGRPKPGLPLDAVAIEEIQAVELYGQSGDGTGMLAKAWPGGPCGSTPTIAEPSRVDNRSIARFAVIWLR